MRSPVQILTRMHLDALWTVLSSSRSGRREEGTRTPSIPQILLFHACEQTSFLRRMCDDSAWTSQPQFSKLAGNLLDELSQTAVLLYSFAEEFHRR